MNSEGHRPPLERESTESLDYSVRLETEGKTREQLQEMRSRLQSLLEEKGANISAEESSQINSSLEEIDAAERELSPQDEPEVSTTQSQESHPRESPRDAKIQTAQEILSILDEPINDVPEDILISQANSLLRLRDWSNRNKRPELADALNKRFRALKARAFAMGMVDKFGNQILEDTEEEAPKGQNEEDLVPQDKGDLVERVRRERLRRKDRMAQEEASRKMEVLEPQAALQREETPEALESPEEIEREQEAIVEALLPEEGTPEEEEEIKKAVKEGWFKTRLKKVMGLPIRNIAKDFATGAAVGVPIGIAVKSGLRMAFGVSGLGLSVAGGAGAAWGRKEFFAWRKRGHYSKAEKMLGGELTAVKAGEFLEKVYKKKLSSLDALKLVGERKAWLEVVGVPADLQEITTIEKRLIEHAGDLSKLQGRDRLDEYMRIVKSAELDEEKVKEENKKRRELEREFAELSGRKVTKKQMVQSMVVGAIGGLIGFEVAENLSPNFHDWFNKFFDHHPKEFPPVPKDVIQHVDTLKVAPTVPDTSHIPPPIVEAVPISTPEPLPDHLVVKGTVWGTLKEFYESKGAHPTNDQLNQAVRFLAHQNHIGIAADNPLEGSYEVLDTEIPDGFDLKGLDQVADLNNLPAVDVTVIEHVPIEPGKLSSEDIASLMNTTPEGYEMLDPTHTTVSQSLRWVSDANIRGEKALAGVWLAETNPGEDDWNKTIEEYVNSHYEAAHPTAPAFKDVVHHHTIPATHGPKMSGIIESQSDALPKAPEMNIPGVQYAPPTHVDIPHVPEVSSLPKEELFDNVLTHFPRGGEGIQPENLSKGEKGLLDWVIWGGGAVAIGLSAAGAGIALNKYEDLKRREREAKGEVAEEPKEEIPLNPEKPKKRSRMRELTEKLKPKKPEIVIMETLFDKNGKPEEQALDRRDAVVLRTILKMGEYEQFLERLLKIWGASRREEKWVRDKIEVSIETMGRLPSKEAKRLSKEYLQKIEDLKMLKSTYN